LASTAALESPFRLGGSHVAPLDLLEDAVELDATAVGSSAAGSDYESWLVLSARYLDLAGDAGALARLPLALSTRAGADTYARRLSAAASLIGEEHVAPPGPRCTR
jgi:hypothetical protein